MTTEELKVLITAETKGFQAQLDKVKNQVNSLDKSVKRATTSMTKSFKTLLGALGFTTIVAGMVKVGKSALQMASDLTEVENRVKVAFGNMAGSIDKFSKEAIRQFGLGELTYKQTASKFMALATSLGIASGKGYEMAKTLTELSGDMASFYDVQQDVIETALSAVFTGETEAIKNYGVILTEANLQQFAYEQGINKSISAMSQAEKVALRYSYVLKATAIAQGDFARTSGSWANQIRILNEQWRQFLALVGQGLVQVFTPVVQVLNEVLSFLVMIGNAIAKVFGGKGISGISSTTSGLSDVSSGLEDIGEEASGASEKAKELQKTLMGFDEIHQLSKPNDAESSGTGAGGGGGGIDITPVVDEKEEEGQLSKIEEFLENCKNIIQKWKDTVPPIEINFDKEKAMADLEEIGLNIVNTIAGWTSFFITIGVKVANDLDVGVLANKFLNLTASLTGLASTMTDILVPAFEKFYDIAISPLVQWIGDKLGDAMDGIAKKADEWKTWFQDNSEQVSIFIENCGEVVKKFDDILIKIADAAWTTFATALGFINDQIKLLATNLINLNADQLEKIAEAILTLTILIEGIKLANLLKIPVILMDTIAMLNDGYSITEAFGFAFDIHLGKKAAAALDKVKGALSETSFNITNVGKLLGTVFKSPITWIIAAIVAIGAEMVHLYKTNDEFKAKVDKLYNETIKPALDELMELLGELWNDHIKPILEKIDISGIISTITGLVGGLFSILDPICNLIIDALNLIFPLLKQISDAVLPVIIEILGGLIDIVGGVISAVVDGINLIIPIIEGIKTILQGLIDFISGVFTGDFDKAIQGLGKMWDGLGQALIGVLEFVGTILYDLVEGIVKAVKKWCGDIYDTVKEWFEKVGDWFEEFWDNIKEGWNKFWDGVEAIVESIVSGIAKWWENLMAKTSEIFNRIFDAIKSIWETISFTVATVVSTIVQTVIDKWNNFRNNLKEKCEGIKNDIKSKFEEIKNGITDKIKTAVDTAVNKFTSFKSSVVNIITGIKNSISPIIDSIKSLIQGMVNVANNVATTVSNIVSKIKSALSGAKADAAETEALAGKNTNAKITITTNESRRMTGVQMAEGGLLQNGQVFIARESGPELVGSFGNQSGVANNFQIVEGIKQGVMEAMMATNSNNNGETSVNLYLDSSLVAKKVIKYHNDVVKQTGLSPLMV